MYITSAITSSGTTRGASSGTQARAYQSPLGRALKCILVVTRFFEGRHVLTVISDVHVLVVV